MAATTAVTMADTANTVFVADTTGVTEAAVTMAVTPIAAILMAARTTAIRIPSPGRQAPPARTTARQIPLRNPTAMRPAKAFPMAVGRGWPKGNIRRHSLFSQSRRQANRNQAGPRSGMRCRQRPLEIYGKAFGRCVGRLR